ncbi:MAG: ribonuclease HI [Chlorobium limicola]|jgi:ribonuclease HI|uniref:Ribonuclease H n=1 Tax=Chlorobium limicola (strain DSM 245 / NBRC 103803 / 6330) TaxID=290315 RepID=RNH_CHLL2|nr:ribonuclease HI [Chlorobium limicola]B3EH35.1 RecName: Full=Ribonuclease H; Short=RNase H [Chlorobium limicola DSM 245]ACD89715.1 Ribonuclease H [Chlorobium limicola DSM 245]NTV08903.1 ribonuclease HI [Chlorobium limicola]NTV20573.1 ribonuclease HI [Chlorobium limicola]
MKKRVTIYTDGACSGNPGRGGWGALMMYGTVNRELSGYEPATTNNRMELTAAIEGLDALKEPCVVDLYSDSAYLVNALNQGWLKRWTTNNWTTSAKKSVENIDLWKKILKLVTLHQVTFHKVKGHSDNPFNNRCDELARQAIKNNS